MNFFYFLLVFCLCQYILGYEVQDFGSFSMAPLPDSICDIPSNQCNQYNLNSYQLQANLVNRITVYGYFYPLPDSDTSTLFQIYDKNLTNLRFEIKVQPQTCSLFIKTLQDVDNSLVQQEAQYQQFGCSILNPQPFEFLIFLNYQDLQNFSQGLITLFLNFNVAESQQPQPFVKQIPFSLPQQRFLSSNSVLQICSSKLFGNLKNLRIIYNYDLPLFMLTRDNYIQKLNEMQVYLKGSLQPFTSPTIYKMDYYHNFKQFYFYDLTKQKVGRFNLAGLEIPIQKLSSVQLIYPSGFHLPLNSTDLKSSPIGFGVTLNLKLLDIPSFRLMLKINFNEGRFANNQLFFLMPNSTQISNTENGILDTFTVGMSLRFNFDLNKLEVIQFNDYVSNYFYLNISDNIEYYYDNYKILSIKDIQIFRQNFGRKLQQSQNLNFDFLEARVYSDKFGIEFQSDTQEAKLPNCNITAGIYQKICIRCNRGYLLNHNGTCSNQCDEGYYKLGRDCIKVCAHGMQNQSCLIPSDCKYLNNSFNPSCDSGDVNCSAKFGNQCFQCNNSIQYQSQCLNYTTASNMNIQILSDNQTAIDIPQGYLNGNQPLCSDQYYIQDQECVKQCSPGYNLTSDGLNCARQNMIYYNETGRIYNQILLNCLYFDESQPQSCLICQEGYKLNSQSLCIQEIDNCHDYDNSQKNCIKCNDGYFLQTLDNGGGGGVSFANNLSRRLIMNTPSDSPTACVKQCSPSYYLDYMNLQCINTGSPSCLQRKGFRCLQCSTGFYLECGQCIQYDNSIFNNTNLLPINGKENNYITATTCRQNYTLFQSQCIFNYPPDRYYLDNSNLTPCDQSCFKCYNSTICLVKSNLPKGCDQGFYPHDQGCYSCSLECSECYGPENGQCTKCINGYILSGNLCTIQFPDRNYTQIDSSQNCVDYNLSTFQCQSCNQTQMNFVVDYNGECSTYCYRDLPILDTVNKKCVQQCPTGTLLDNTNPQQLKCTQCGSGQYYDEKNCKVCIQNCVQCSNNSSCDQCANKYFYKLNACMQCFPNCQNCQDDQTCFQCETGFDLIKTRGDQCVSQCTQGQFRNPSYACTSCIKNCQKCTDDQSCIACSSGFEFVISLKQCSKICETNQFRNDQGVCTPCPLSNCQLCASQSLCSVCTSGFVLNKQLLLCVSTQCLDGQFFDYSIQSCQNCSIGCKKCTSLDECSVCYKSDDPTQNYFLSPQKIAPNNLLVYLKSNQYYLLQSTPKSSQGYCYTKCPDQLRPDTINNICCDPTCLTCNRFQQNNCLSCPPSYALQLDTQTCKISCKQGEYISNSSKTASSKTMFPQYDTVLQICSQCQPECQTCSDGNNCLTCKIGYFFQNGKCVKECALGYRLDSIQRKICCDSSCESCFDSLDTGCINCLNELYSIDKSSNKCVYDKAKADKIKGSTNSTSEVIIPKQYCHWSCSKCSNFEYDSCQECISSERIFYRGTCSCPPGYEDIGSECQPTESQGDAAFISLNYIVLISFFGFTLSGKYPLFSINVLFISQFAGYFTYFQEPANVYNKDYIYKAFNIDNLSYFFPNPLKSSYLRNLDSRYDQKYVEMQQQIPNDFRYILNEKSQNFLFNVFPLILFALPFCLLYLISRFAKDPSNTSQNRLYWLYGRILQALRMSMQWNVFLLIMIFSYQEVITFLALQFQHIDTSNGINAIGMLLSFVGVVYAVYVPAIVYYGINVATFDKHTKYGVLFMNCINDTTFSGKNQLLMMLIFKATFSIIFASGGDKGSTILLVLLIYGIYRIAEIALNFRTTQRSKIFLIINCIITLLIFVLSIYAYSLSKYKDANLSKFYSYDFAQSQIKTILIFIFSVKVLIMILEMVSLLFFYNYVQYIYHKDFQWATKSQNTKKLSSNQQKKQPNIIINQTNTPQVSDQVLNSITKMVNQPGQQIMNNPFLMLTPNTQNTVEMSLTSQINSPALQESSAKGQFNQNENHNPFLKTSLYYQPEIQSEYKNNEDSMQTPTDNNMINSYEINNQNPFLIQYK
ncbi:hypothetical protein ABPG72_011686 [Tetrahymena utriculariae]